MSDGPMTWNERRLLKKIAKRLCTQGYDHKGNIAEYYQIMQKAAEAEFTEDNKPTLEGYLDDRFQDARNFK